MNVATRVRFDRGPNLNRGFLSLSASTGSSRCSSISKTIIRSKNSWNASRQLRGLWPAGFWTGRNQPCSNRRHENPAGRVCAVADAPVAGGARVSHGAIMRVGWHQERQSARTCREGVFPVHHLLPEHALPAESCRTAHRNSGTLDKTNYGALWRRPTRCGQQSKPSSRVSSSIWRFRR